MPDLILNATSKNFNQDLTDLVSFLNNNPKKTLNTHLKTTNPDNAFVNFVKWICVKIFHCPLALTRNEEVAKALYEFSIKNSQLFDATNKTQFRDLFSKSIKMAYNPSTNKAIEDPKANKSLKKCYELFNQMFQGNVATPPKPANKQNLQAAKDFLKELESYPDDAARLNAAFKEDDAERYAKYKNVVELAPFDNTPQSKKLLHDFALNLRQFKYKDLLKDLNNNIEKKGFFVPLPSYLKRNEVDADIVIVKRSELHTKDDKLLTADSKDEECVVLKGLDGKFFGVKIVSEDDPDAIIIKLKNSDREVYVNKNDLIDRLLLDSLWGGSDILSGQLSKHLEKNRILDVLSNYQRMLKKFKPTSKINESELPEICHIAVNNQKDRGYKFSNLFSCDVPKNLNLNNKDLAAGFRGRKLYIFDLKNKEMIAEGGEAKIYTVENLLTGRKTIYKHFDIESYLGAKGEEEVEIIEKLHAGYNGWVPGIIKSPKGFIKEGRTGSGILLKKYEGSLSEALNLDEKHKFGKDLFKSVDDKLLSFYKLLEGFHYCVTQKNLIHNDLKPGNILFNRDSQGNISLYLTDFGSAILANPKIPQKMYYQAPWTAKYVARNDWDLRKHLGYLNNNLITQQNYDAYLSLCQKWDIFSLGCILGELLSPDQNFLDLHLGFPDPDSFKKDLFPADIGDLLEKMLNKDFEERPSIKDVLADFKTLLEGRGIKI